MSKYTELAEEALDLVNNGENPEDRISGLARYTVILNDRMTESERREFVASHDVPSGSEEAAIYREAYNLASENERLVSAFNTWVEEERNNIPPL